MVARLCLLVLAALAPGGCAGPPHLPGLPAPISNNAVASVVRSDGSWTLYSLMGITDPSDTATITTESFRIDAGDSNWRRIADAPALRGRGKIGASAVTVAGEVYLIGGYAVVDERTELTEPRLLRYDDADDAWIELAPPPVEVDDTLAAVWRDRWIVLVSGWHGPAHANVRDVQLFDTHSNTWTAGTPLPGPGLFGHAGGISGDTLLVIDGVTDADGFAISDAVYIGRLDPDEPGRIEWREAPAHPGRPTYRAAASTTHSTDGPIYVLGGTDNPYNISGIGYDGNPSAPLDQLLVFDPGAQTFTTHPSPCGPLMDLRGLVPLGAGRWATVGGMTESGGASAGVRSFVRERPRLRTP